MEQGATGEGEGGGMSDLPTFNEYGGGGVILSQSTPYETIKMYCKTRGLLLRVLAFTTSGIEVMVHHGDIVAAQNAKGGKGCSGQ